MLVKNRIHFKNHISSYLLLLFILLLVSSALYSHFFQAPIEQFDAKKLEFNPLKKELIEGIKSIEITNKFGTFLLQKDPDSVDFNGDGFDDETHDLAWIIKTPAVTGILSGAKAGTINLILTDLRNMITKKSYRYDEINLSNFVLDKPTLAIKLATEKENQTALGLGLINNDKKVQYLGFQGEKSEIYEINHFNWGIEGLALANLLDSKVFLGNNKNIETVEIYRGKNLDVDPIMALLNKDQTWYDASYEALSDKKVQDFLKKLFSIKSNVILDQLTEEAQAAVDAQLEKPTYTLILKNKANDGVAYTISDVISFIPGVKMDRKSVIISVSNRPHPYLIGKESLPNLNISSTDLREGTLKKLFN